MCVQAYKKYAGTNGLRLEVTKFLKSNFKKYKHIILFTIFPENLICLNM